MDKDELKNLIIYTGVYYADNELYRTRSQIWFKTCDNAQRLGIRVVVRNDGGLPEEMLTRIKAYSNITIIEKDTSKKNTLGSGRGEALQKAIDIAKEDGISNPVFLWTEAEKDDLITEKNLLPLVREVLAGNNIVVAAREKKAWDQLPPFQRFMEKRANKRANATIPAEHKPEAELDFWFAPKAFDESGAEEMLAYNPNKDRLDLWDSIMVPIVEAMKKGKKVKGLPVDFLYNEKQIEVESDESNREIKIKRLEQYAQILKELGDPEWKEFFENSKEELARVKELRKDDPKLSGESGKEARRSLVKKF